VSVGDRLWRFEVVFIVHRFETFQWLVSLVVSHAFILI